MFNRLLLSLCYVCLSWSTIVGLFLKGRCKDRATYIDVRKEMSQKQKDLLQTRFLQQIFYSMNE